MFSKPKSAGLFSYETKNYPNGTRKETRWSLGGTGLLLVLVVVGLCEGIPIGKIIEALKTWSWLGR
jgi:hypothetical protein